MDLRRRAIILELAKRLSQLLDLPVTLFVQTLSPDFLKTENISYSQVRSFEKWQNLRIFTL